jgi:hypothetical protein
MGQRWIRATILTLAAMLVLLPAGLYKHQVFGQGAAGPQAAGAPPQGQAPGARGARGGGRGGQQPGPTASPKAGATVDLTGYWVSLVTEDWRWRMKVPDKGDVASIPFTNDQAKRAVLQAWDPAKDEAEGNQCKAYGAAAIMRVPTRVHITWDGDNVLKLETDAGMQTRLFRFEPAAQAATGERTWQGVSVAEWEPSPAGARGGRGGGGGGGFGPPGVGGGGFGPPDGFAPPAGLAAINPPNAGPLPTPAGPAVRGDLKVVTTNLKPGYLRKNGVPYSDKTTVTEYFNRTPETYGITYMVVTTVVDDPEYLTGPFITSSHFKKLPDTNNGWDPTPCSVR